MKVVDTVQEIAKELEKRIDTKIISAVAYGNDIYMEMGDANDYNMLLVIEKCDLTIAMKISKFLKDREIGNLKKPLIVEKDEIEGMMDSVPQSILDILLSYQTAYGEQIIKGLSSISHEYLRAQTERSLRENICKARLLLIEWLGEGESKIYNILVIRDIFLRSLIMYHLLTKPWLTENEEHLDSFYDEFKSSKETIRALFHENVLEEGDLTLGKLCFSSINNGIVLLMHKVDEMGPT